MMNKVWGWKGRVGLIMPAGQQVTEPLFYAIAPEGISFHTARLQLIGTHPEDVAEMERRYAAGAIEELVQARVQCIAYMCVGGGLLRGRDGEEQFCAEIQKKTGIPVISALFAILEALNVLKLHKIVLANPYVKEVEEMEKKFLQSDGFEVLGAHGLGISDTFELGQVTTQEIYTFCKKVWDQAAEGLHIGCCAFNAMPVIELLEKELNVPVVTAHSAVLWKILKTLGIKEPVRGFGRLLSEHL